MSSQNFTINGGVNAGVVSQGNYNEFTKPGSRPKPEDGIEPGADLGVLIVLPQERRAVVDLLASLDGYRTRRHRDGPTVHEALLPAGPGRPLRVVAVQTLQPGPASAALAHAELVRRHRPAVVLLVGVAGAVDERLRIGDVVVSDMVISYDARRETSGGPAVRGSVTTVTARLGHRLNDFFAATRGRMSDGAGPAFGVYRGPIGSGGAVITDAGSGIRSWLRTVNEKVLAVETEAVGVAQAFHEQVDRKAPYGWLTIRGISDAADEHKPIDQHDHDLASRHAAAVLFALAPYLTFGDGG